MKPTAKYIGRFKTVTGKNVRMYDIYGGKYDGSTVTEQTLIDLGIPIPDPSNQRPLERPDEKDGD